MPLNSPFSSTVRIRLQRHTRKTTEEDRTTARSLQIKHHISIYIHQRRHQQIVENSELEAAGGALEGIPTAHQAKTIGSLRVANVQALAEACGVDGQQVPERYLSKDPSSKEVGGGGSGGGGDITCAIPVIDLHRLDGPRSSEEECAKLASACHDWGFFQLINHGLPEEVTGNLMNDVVKFFKQPLEDKKEWSQQADSLEGYGQAFVVSGDQKLDWADMLYLQVHPTETRDPRFWPTRPESFRRSVDVYSSEARELAYRLLEFMAKGVGADPATLRGVFQGQVQGMRVNYYPPCRQAADRVLGLSPHTDACGLTLLLQTSRDVQGLQVNKGGRWFAVQAVDGAFIVNVGDVLEIMSNGKFKSVEHRAVVHPTKERISVALFHYPCQDMVLGPLPEFTKGDKERYGSANYREFLKQYFSEKLDGRKHLDRLKLER